jgi:hypothetical protein
MALQRLTQRALFVALLPLLALAALPGVASAAPGQVVKEDPTGAVFTYCRRHHLHRHRWHRHLRVP